MLRARFAVLLLVAGLAGCDGGIADLPITLTPTETTTATPSRTPTPVDDGPVVTFMGVLLGQNTLTAPIGIDSEGRSIYERPIGNGFVIVVEAKPGPGGRAVGLSTYEYNPEDPATRPDLQIEANHALGNGSLLVCDNELPEFGGVPGLNPPRYDDTQAVADALNDFGCRFRDGSGDTQGRTSEEPCVLAPDGEFRFVDPTSTVQYCGTITRPMAFPQGDTILTARVRDVDGILGEPEQIVLHIIGAPLSTPTPTAPATATPTTPSS